EGGWVDNAPIDVVGLSLMGVIAQGLEKPPQRIPDMHVFYDNGANNPSLHHANIYANAMVEAGQLASLPTQDELAAVFRSDLYRQAAKAVGDLAPTRDDAAFLSKPSNETSPANLKESDAI
ncbi:MAG: hypothetical protein AAFO01_06510, partial [Pseudomonadota bacterium]